MEDKQTWRPGLKPAPLLRPICGLQLIFGNFGRFITSPLCGLQLIFGYLGRFNTSLLCGLQLIFGNFGRGHSLLFPFWL